ncbi:transposase [Bacillus sp. P2(2020)]|uniref:Transposase n=1 Tax=Calidifontibacillus erzurumensis TaxID=2741433 RepID=A0A8J8GFP0_9BACI|nr:transposase [Calidifontibacillus erzurumensis]
MHILFETTPQVQLSNTFKTAKSRYIRKEFAKHLSKFYWKPYFWNRSHLILNSGVAPLEVIKNIYKNKKCKLLLFFAINSP